MSGTYISPNKRIDGPDPIVSGDQLVFMDEGVIRESKFKDNSGNLKSELVLTVQIIGREKEGDFLWTPNKTSIKEVQKQFGKDSKEWIGKRVNLLVQETRTPSGMKQGVFVGPMEEAVE